MAKKDKSPQAEDVDPRSPVIDLKAEDVTEETPPPEPASSEYTAPEPESEVPPSPPPPPPAPSRRARSSTKLWGGMALAAIAALGGAWLYKDYGSRYWPSDEMTAMAARVATLEASNKTLNEQLSAVGVTLDQVKAGTGGIAEQARAARDAASSATQTSAAAQDVAKAMADKLAAAEGRLAATQKAVENLKAVLSATPASSDGATITGVDPGVFQGLGDRIASLEKDVAEIKAKGPAPGAQTATLLSQTLSDLKAKLATGAPYKDELQKIAGLVPAAPGLDALAASADMGAATPEMLAGEAKALAEKLTPPPAPENSVADDGYWHSFVSMIGSVVKIRNVGQTDWQAIAVRAGEAAGEGKLAEALDIAIGEGDMPDTLRIWREKVQARITADAASEELSSAVLRQISALGGAQ